MKMPLVAIGVGLIVPPLISFADDYQFIISGDPVAAAMSKTCVAVSSGKALVSGTLSGKTGSGPIEARFCTWSASMSKALRSDGRGISFIIR